MLLAYLNALICAITCLRLLTFRRRDSEHRPLAAWLAYVLILATGSVTIRTVLGVYALPVDPGELAINAALCGGALAMRGSVAWLLPPTKALR